MKITKAVKKGKGIEADKKRLEGEIETIRVELESAKQAAEAAPAVDPAAEAALAEARSEIESLREAVTAAEAATAKRARKPPTRLLARKPTPRPPSTSAQRWRGRSRTRASN